mgnify:CR=1 FL=1
MILDGSQNRWNLGLWKLVDISRSWLWKYLGLWKPVDINRSWLWKFSYGIHWKSPVFIGFRSDFGKLVRSGFYFEIEKLKPILANNLPFAIVYCQKQQKDTTKFFSTKMLLFELFCRDHRLLVAEHDDKIQIL